MLKKRKKKQRSDPLLFLEVDMRTLVTASEMKQVEKTWMEEFKVSSLAYMETAAQRVAAHIMEDFKPQSSVHVVAGYGNNGGDGLVIARILFINGYDVSISMIGNENKISYECMRQLITVQKLGMEFLSINDDSLKSKDVIVDALFGIGLTRNIEGEFKNAIDVINNAHAFVYAVDIPSGIDSDNGMIRGVAVCANKTVTLGIPKRGMYFYPGAKYAGDIVIEDIGLLDVFGITSKSSVLVDEKYVKSILPKRYNDSNKGTYGKVFSFCGSTNMPGAALLSGEAALRTGIGLLKMLVPKENKALVCDKLPECILELDKEKAKENVDWANAILCGCGIGKTEESKAILKDILTYANKSKDKGLVLDADALNMISEDEKLIDIIPDNSILTPHMLEMSRLAGKSVDEIKEDRIKIGCDFAMKYNVVLVLKDAVTCIFDKDGRTFIVNNGDNGMSTGGSGDVLAGIITGLLAQKECRSIDAAVAGVYLHALSAKIALDKNTSETLIASDIIGALQAAYKTCH